MRRVRIASIQRSVGLALILVLAVSPFLPADSLAIARRGRSVEQDGKTPGPYEQGESLARGGDCAAAIPLFERALESAPDDADALNLLAYCERNTGRLDEALAHYRRALEVRPDFPEARQYLGEAHLAAVLEQVEILRSYGDSGREELATLVAALHEAARRSGAPSSPGPAADGGRW